MPPRKYRAVPSSAPDRNRYTQRNIERDKINGDYYTYFHTICGYRHRYGECNKGENMNDRAGVLEGRKEQLRKRIDAAADELALLDKFPEEDTFEEGAAIRWTVEAPNGNKAIYFAGKTGPYWYFTGRNGPSGANNFGTLINLITSDNNGKLLSVEITKKSGWKDILG